MGGREAESHNGNSGVKEFEPKRKLRRPAVFRTEMFPKWLLSAQFAPCGANLAENRSEEEVFPSLFATVLTVRPSPVRHIEPMFR
jgi:hypothetical protein